MSWTSTTGCRSARASLCGRTELSRLFSDPLVPAKAGTQFLVQADARLPLARERAEIGYLMLCRRLHGCCGLAEQDGAFLGRTNAAGIRIDFRRPVVGFDHRGPRLDRFKPALEVREIGD